jgi:hypothetical protein
MTDREIALSSGIRGWFAGCLAGTFVLLLHGFVMTALAPSGLSLKALLAGLFLSTVHLTFMAIYTAIPAAIFMWTTHMLRIEFLILFAAFGGLLGWPVNRLFPYTSDKTLTQFVVAGIVAGIATWYFMKKSRRSLSASAAAI